jgi:hypothetical protein
VQVGVIVERCGAPPSSDQWQWICGSNPGDDRHGTAASFEVVRAAFEAAWRDYLPKRSEADFASDAVAYLDLCGPRPESTSLFRIESRNDCVRAQRYQLRRPQPVH